MDDSAKSKLPIKSVRNDKSQTETSRKSTSGRGRGRGYRSHWGRDGYRRNDDQRKEYRQEESESYRRRNDDRMDSREDDDRMFSMTNDDRMDSRKTDMKKDRMDYRRNDERTDSRRQRKVYDKRGEDRSGQYRRNDREEKCHRKGYERRENESDEGRNSTRKITEQKSVESMSNGHVEFIHGDKFQQENSNSSHKEYDRKLRAPKPHQPYSRRSSSGSHSRSTHTEFGRRQQREEFR